VEVSVLLGYTKYWRQGLAIVLLSVSAGAPNVGGLGGSFMCLWCYVSLCQSSCFMRFWLCPVMSLCACGVTCELLCGYRPLVVCTILLLLWVHVTMDGADIAVQFIWLV
jgi:hypothetical protein